MGQQSLFVSTLWAGWGKKKQEMEKASYGKKESTFKTIYLVYNQLYNEKKFP